MVSDIRTVDGRLGRTETTPRQSAHRHLPDLDRDWPEWQSRFQATLQTITTPDGNWGTDPTAGWPRLRLDEYGPPWKPARQGRGRA